VTNHIIDCDPLAPDVAVSAPQDRNSRSEKVMLRRWLFGATNIRRTNRQMLAAAPLQQTSSASTTTPAAITPAYGVLFDAASQELDAQLTSADALDQKAATVFSVASTVAVVVPALLPLGKSGLEFKSWAFGFLCAGGAGYVATLVLFFLAYRPGRWASGPDLERLREVIVHGENYARRWAADAYVLSIEVTRLAVKSKRRFLNGVMAAFVFEIVMLVVAAVSTFSR
jgi:hypothetical protein